MCSIVSIWLHLMHLSLSVIPNLLSLDPQNMSPCRRRSIDVLSFVLVRLLTILPRSFTSSGLTLPITLSSLSVELLCIALLISFEVILSCLINVCFIGIFWNFSGERVGLDLWPVDY